MLRSMDNAGVRTLVFSSHEALFRPDTGNDYTAAVVRRWPDRFRGMMVINGNYMDIVERDVARFDRMRDAFLGFKFLPSYHGVAMDDPRYDDVWRFAAERRLPVTVHTWGQGDQNNVRNVESVACRFPEVRLLLAHSLHGRWEDAARLATSYPHVYLDLTAVFECRGTLELFAERGASRRLLFGTDLPWFSPLQGIGCVLSAEISDDDRRSIFHRNAEPLIASGM